MKMLRKLSAVLLFAALTLAVLAAANFLLVDDVHSYSRAMLQELYADAGKIDTLFLGSSHCYRSVDPDAVDAALGTYSFNAGSSQQLPDGSYYMLREAAAQNQLKTVYLEMFYTGYNQSASKNVPLACPTTCGGIRPTATPTRPKWAAWPPLPTCCCRPVTVWPSHRKCPRSGAPS